jgi:phosphoribosylformylglycinamidine synthase
VGIDIEVTRVPQREDAMKPFEIMVSESQERMVAVVNPEKLEAVTAVCEKWGLRSTVIGTVTDTGRFVIRENGTVVGDMPAATLAHDAPEYDPAMTRPAYLDVVHAADLHDLRHPIGVEPLTMMLESLLASPNICSRRWIWEQYDHQVMLDTVVLPGGDAAVLRVKGTDRAIAATSDCNGRYCYLDPYTGAQIAFAEAARNLACVGARPAAITDCLNFGNPEKPEVYWTFYEAVRGLSDACTAFEVPVISGNVSFYNESFGEPIYPTPTVGMVGVLEDVTKHTTSGFRQAADVVFLLGETWADLGGSEYLKIAFEKVEGRPPALDLVVEQALHEAVLQAIELGLLQSAHDCSEGGLGVTLAESCIAGGVGAQLRLPAGLPPAVALFSESQSRVVVSVDPVDAEALEQSCSAMGVPFVRLGTVGGDRLVIEHAVDAPVARLADIYDSSLERAVFPPAAE